MSFPTANAHAPRFLAPLLAVLVLCAFSAPALAETTASSNWSGYAVHQRGVSFKWVTGTWRAATAACVPGTPGYSATWVGIGGYGLSSRVLEQIGTETDCTGSGDTVTSAWYELVPNPSSRVRLKVHPGDAVTATVSIAGHRVTLKLSDRTTGRSFTKIVAVPFLDTGSAEWIEEAPSECTIPGRNCRTLPLADFGSVTFTGASARERSGLSGSISSRLWDATRITLASSGRTSVPHTLTPSALGGHGGGFSIGYADAATVANNSRGRILPAMSRTGSGPVVVRLRPPATATAARQGRTRARHRIGQGAECVSSCHRMSGFPTRRVG